MLPLIHPIASQYKSAIYDAIQCTAALRYYTMFASYSITVQVHTLAAILAASSATMPQLARKSVAMHMVYTHTPALQHHTAVSPYATVYSKHCCSTYTAYD
eukprot:1826-Heterococcus_DN1.PRE.1